MEDRRNVLFVVRVLINDATCFKEFFIYLYKITRFGISHFIINTVSHRNITVLFSKIFFSCFVLVFEALYLFRKFGIIFYFSISDHYMIQS
jgi:hypothetical protein